MATIYEVSKLAGVSLATVSRVMNGTAKVSAKTEAKVQEAMKELGYRPNSVAISLASKRSNCVGLLVAELDGVFFGSMMYGIEGELRKVRKHSVVTAGHGDKEQEQQGIEFLQSHNCDALIVHAERLSDEYLINLCKGETPVYVLNRFIPEIAQRCISLDNELGGYIAAKHILEQGHRDIVNITGPEYKEDAQMRVSGFKRALQEFNIEFDETRLFTGNYLQESGAAAIDHFLKQDIEFTAVVGGNDQMAIGAMAQLRRHDLIPGKDISVIGFDNVAFASCTFPGLTTIQYPIAQMGKAAANLVIDEVYKNKSLASLRVFEPSLIVRQSVQRLNN